MVDTGLIWRITVTLSALSMAMFAFLILRRAWHELRARKLAVRRRAIRQKVFLLLALEHERFVQRCQSPDYFTRKERRLLHQECLALCQIIKGSDQQRVIELMRLLQYQRDDLLDLKRGSEDYRYAAAISLQYFNDARVRKALRAALQDRSGEVALAAAHSLQAMQALPAIDLLLQLLSERGLLQAASCRTLCHKIALQTPEQLVEAERRFRDHAAIRTLLAEGMGHASSYCVLPALMRLAQDPAHLVRIAALRALTRLQHPSSHSAILAALDDEHWDVRSAAAVAAGEFRLMEALPKLDSLLDADNWMLRFNTALSLYQLGVAGRRVLLHRTRKPDVAGRTANLVMSEKGVASLMPTW